MLHEVCVHGAEGGTLLIWVCWSRLDVAVTCFDHDVHEVALDGAPVTPEVTILSAEWALPDEVPSDTIGMWWSSG